MSREAQELALTDFSFRPLRKVVFACLAVLPLAACAGGFDLDKAGVDSTLTTGAVPKGNQPQPDAAQLSDETTIRNAVSSADLAALSASGLPWANVETGSRGAITGLVEYNKDGALCRKFSASRESFNGVRLYSGDACRVIDGSWRMLGFVES